MRVRRAPAEDPLDLARRILPALDAANARNERTILVDLPPCTIGRPVESLAIEHGPGPHRRLALCAVCDDEPLCPGFLEGDDRVALSAAVRPRIRPQRDLALQRRVLTRLREIEDLAEHPVADIEEALLARVGSRPWGAGTPLEFSAAWRGGRPYLYRYSCALPDADHGEIDDDLDFVDSLLSRVPGVDLEPWRLLRAERSRIERVLFGLEAFAGQILRAKVYVEYRSGPHMIGLDLRPDGDSARKVYRREPHARGRADVVHIEAPPGTPRAVDRSLLWNDLGFEHVEKHAAKHGGPDLAPLRDLLRDHPIVPTRFSVSVRDPRDVTVYYWVVPPADPGRAPGPFGGLGSP